MRASVSTSFLSALANQRCTRAPPPFINLSTSSFDAIEVSVVVMNPVRGCRHPLPSKVIGAFAAESTAMTAHHALSDSLLIILPLSSWKVGPLRATGSILTGISHYSTLCGLWLVPVVC